MFYSMTLGVLVSLGIAHWGCVPIMINLLMGIAHSTKTKNENQSEVRNIEY